ncbi:hypothetical protein SAMN05421831_104184 [Allopseudospirillum japonicum]|uniref:Uncharacterized protein n=1 Tax=Allopseudospirillum japonicum TaxID=64971 RepID=A0A1H6RZ28_9GAMM|nr:hypothetical protein SAMN05421831_104184 [Allopseudospirillum japonicum]
MIFLYLSKNLLANKNQVNRGTLEFEHPQAFLFEKLDGIR